MTQLLSTKEAQSIIIAEKQSEYSLSATEKLIKTKKEIGARKILGRWHIPKKNLLSYLRRNQIS